jgi:hypothetical protein
VNGAKIDLQSIRPSVIIAAIFAKAPGTRKDFPFIIKIALGGIGHITSPLLCGEQSPAYIAGYSCR